MDPSPTTHVKDPSATKTLSWEDIMYERNYEGNIFIVLHNLKESIISNKKEPIGLGCIVNQRTISLGLVRI